MDLYPVGKMRPYLKVIVITLGLLTILFCSQISSPPEDFKNFTTTQRTPISVSPAWRRFFHSHSFLVPVLIIDTDLLRSISLGEAPPEALERKLVVAVEERFRFSRVSKQDEQVEVFYYSSTRTDRDYWVFEMNNETRAMNSFELYSSHRVFLPSDIPTFLDDWQHSRLLGCHTTLKRNATSQERAIPLSIVQDMAELRDFIKQRGARILLAGGTLLGWYRECSLIPHTTDIDFFVRADEYNPSIVADLDVEPSPYKLSRIYGMPSDSYELTVNVKAVDVNMDLFFLYTDDKESYVGGLAWHRRQKYKWTYPRITEVCTADLHGRLFHVPCNTRDVLEKEYGNWREDAPTADFVWYKSHRNIQENGFYSAEQMRGMRQTGWRWLEDLVTILHDINLINLNS